MISYIKKHKYNFIVFLAFLLLFLYFLSKIIGKSVSNLDELWNYNIARNIAKGLIPYKDISMITTPFLPVIEALVIKTTVDELIVFRIMNALLITIIIFFSYKIFEVLIKNKLNSAIMAFLLVFIFKEDIFLDYNFFTLLLSLIMVFLELKTSNDKKNRNIIIGVIGGIAVCTKQTIGVLICLNIVILQFIRDIKDKQFKNTIKRIIGIFIPIVLLVLYLLITNSINDFISYTLLSIGTFDNTISYLSLIRIDDIIIKTLAIITPSFIISVLLYLIIYKGKNRESYTSVLNIFVYAIPLLLIEYPISDRVHFILANYIIIMLMIYSIYLLLRYIYEKTNLKTKKYILLTVKCFFALLIIVKLGIVAYEKHTNYINTYNYSGLEHYNNLIVSQFIGELCNDIRKVETEFEKEGKSVAILDSNAVIIHIPMDKYIKNYDMFNKGNLGMNGEDGIIEEIKNKKNQVYLIRKDEIDKNWQNPNKITDFVKNNLNKIGEKSLYDIYTYN